MTTTTKKANGNRSPEEKAEPLGDGWDDAAKASAGESDHPAWVPQWSMFKADVIEQKMTTVPEGSTSVGVLVGKLAVLRAFGEPRYFVKRDDGTTLALPLHGVLTSSLDCIALDPAPTVRLEYKGEAARARPNERAAFVYDVRVKPSSALLPQAREDALLPVHRENKEKRESGKKKGASRAADESEAADG